METALFEAVDAASYLHAKLEEKRRRNGLFSLRAWARQLGFRNPSPLSAILRGERPLPPELAERIAGVLRLDEGETRYLKLLALASGARSDGERTAHRAMARAVALRLVSRELGEDQFALIAEWYHGALIAMVDLKDFESDPVDIAERLGGEVTPAEIEQAIERLLRLGILQRDAEGRLEGTDYDVRTGDRIPSAVIRKAHKDAIQRAIRSIEEQPMSERDIRTSVMCLKREDLPKVQALIKDFHAQLRQLIVPGEGDVVYRFNSQFFYVTVS